MNYWIQIDLPKKFISHSLDRNTILQIIRDNNEKLNALTEESKLNELEMPLLPARRNRQGSAGH
jgi:hypothetical protein